MARFIGKTLNHFLLDFVLGADVLVTKLPFIILDCDPKNNLKIIIENFKL